MEIKEVGGAAHFKWRFIVSDGEDEITTVAGSDIEEVVQWHRDLTYKQSIRRVQWNPDVVSGWVALGHGGYFVVELNRFENPRRITVESISS